MVTSVAEQIADRIDAMPAGERRAAQTLIANYPLIGLKTVVDNIHETFRHLSARQIAQLAGLLADRKSKAFLIGGRFTDPIARYLAAHLAIIRPNVFHLTGQESNWRDRLIDMGKRDVLLIF